jgi:adenylate cyclase
LGIGIGISTGNVFSGVLGSLRKKEYTSIGMAVNIASRLQNMAKEGEILMCERTSQKMPSDIPFDALSPVYIKGLKNPIKVYRIRLS